ncbi:metal-binding protein [Aminipila butyrica]|uniref:Metal-binding protein n=1 Tax=Aminipila butyrica TaxID=433296 RepID=A0A858BUP1_9FIRM|nr:DUF2284 domain-containing protein [Aminipila butyrica]QIB69653.1 metal-binding protein [Aminipila butyrica]
MNYKTEHISTEMEVSKYVKEYVNVEEFLEYCKQCSSYGQKWTCPPFDFDPMGYWNQFQRIVLLGRKIVFDQQDQQQLSKEAAKEEMYDILAAEKKILSEELYEMEEKLVDSVSLSAGSCSLCGDRLMETHSCTRSVCPEGSAKESCRYYHKLRYSIEALGGDVGRTCSKLLGVDLEWLEPDKLPSYFVLVCGLLKK